MDKKPNANKLPDSLAMMLNEPDQGTGTPGLPDETQVIRVESVLSKFPVHTLAKKGSVNIHIKKLATNGKVDVLWDVSPSRKYGEPRILAYRLDTLVINRRIDEIGRPVPRALKLGSLTTICKELDLVVSGGNSKLIKQSLSQNAGAMITAKLSFKDVSGGERELEAVFSRYSVIFTGEKLPNGETADAVYVVFNDIYRNVLNQVPARPLDFKYLKGLPPSAQRFYEILSFKIFSTLKYRHHRTTILYSDYCTASAQPRYFETQQMKKQMYKVHKPHLLSGYIAKVEYDKTTDSDGNLDWEMSYGPGSRAKSEYRRFNLVNRLAGVCQPEAAAPAKMLPPSASEQLVGHFLKQRYGEINRAFSVKELRFADELLAKYGLAASLRLIDICLGKSRQDEYHVRFMQGLAGYLPDALLIIRERQTASLVEAERNARYSAEFKAEQLYAQLSQAELAERETQALAFLTTQANAQNLEDPEMRSILIKCAVIGQLTNGFLAAAQL